MSVYHSQLGKLNFATKHATGITLRLSLDIIGTDENNCSHNLLLTNSQFPGFYNTFVNSSRKNIKLSKTQNLK